MNRQELSPQEAAELRRWELDQLAEVDAEVGSSSSELRKLGVRVFQSHRAFGKSRKGGPKDVVLVKDTDGEGFRQVDLGRIDGRLDNRAHHGLYHLPEEERYRALVDRIEDELVRLRNT